MGLFKGQSDGTAQKPRDWGDPGRFTQSIDPALLAPPTQSPYEPAPAPGNPAAGLEHRQIPRYERNPAAVLMPRANLDPSALPQQAPMPISEKVTPQSVIPNRPYMSAEGYEAYQDAAPGHASRYRSDHDIYRLRDRFDKRSNTDKLKDTLNEPTENFRQKSLMKRLGSGLLQGFRAWGESGGQGGTLGLLGAVAGGGTAGAYSPEGLAQVKKQRRVQEQMAPYAQEQAMQQHELARRKAMFGLQHDIDANTRANQSHDPYEWQQAGDGQSYWRRKGDVNWYPANTFPGDASKAATPVTVDGELVGYQPSSQAVNTTINTRRADRQMQNQRDIAGQRAQVSAGNTNARLGMQQQVLDFRKEQAGIKADLDDAKLALSRSREERIRSAPSGKAAPDAKAVADRQKKSQGLRAKYEGLRQRYNALVPQASDENVATEMKKIESTLAGLKGEIDYWEAQ